MKKYAYSFLGFLVGSSSLPTFGAIASEKFPTNTATEASSNKQDAEMAAWMIEAARAAQEYVNLIDQGKYADSWKQGAKLFQRTISQPEWATALNMVRGKLGAVKSRTVKDQRPAWDPKGLPKGPYMVVEYNTSFEKVPNSGEVLTLMREQDGVWRVLTYQVN